MSLEYFQDLVAELGRNAGSAIPTDENGYASIEVDSTLICNMQYVPANDSVYIFYEIGTILASHLGSIAPRLLAANLFGMETGGGTLAMQEDSHTVIFSYQCGLADMDYARFQQIVDNSIRMAERWYERLGEMNREAVGNASASLPSDNFFAGTMLSV